MKLKPNMTQSHFDLPLNICDKINRVDDMMKKEIKCFIFVNVIFNSIMIEILKVTNYSN